MIEESQATAAICSTTPGAVAEEIGIGAAAGRVLAEPLRATTAIPRFDQSSMDGYALRAADVEAGLRRFAVVGRAAAGAEAPPECGGGQAVRVLTGAPLPCGADTVVMQEDVELESVGEGECIVLAEPPARGEFVRREGAVLCPGQSIGRAGESLTPALLALLASQGIASLKVARRPRVAVVTTGDELVPPGAPLQRHQIHDSNATMLAAAAGLVGAQVVAALHAEDDLDRTVEVFRRSLEVADTVIVAGGVSVGDRDFVRPAAETVGCEEVFWRVNVKPGKPLYYGITGGGGQVFGLPGNPVSALVCFALFVLPALQLRLGRTGNRIGLRTLKVRLSQPVHNRSDRPHYLRGTVESGQFVLQGVQESHGLPGLARADALLRVAPGERCAAGDGVEVRSLGALADCGSHQ